MAEVRLLWKDSTNQSDGIFIRTFFPTMIRVTKIGSGSEKVIDLSVLNIFRPVIVRNASSSLDGNAPQGARQSTTGVLSRFPEHLGNDGESTFPFDSHIQRGSTVTRDHGIGLPVTKLLAVHNVLRTVINADPMRNMRTSVCMTMSFRLSSLVCSGEVWNQVLLLTNIPIIEILIDGFMTDTEPRIVDAESARDLFWGPALFHFAGHVATNGTVLQSRMTVSITLAFGCSLLSTMSMVDIVDRRPVPVLFSRYGTDTASQSYGDMVQGDTTSEQHSNFVSLFWRQMSVRF